MKIVYSPQFAKTYRKLPRSIKTIAENQESIFRKDPFDGRLKTHKLHGRLKDFFSFSIGRKYRIIFELSRNKKTAYFHSVGDHSIYE